MRNVYLHLVHLTRLLCFCFRLVSFLLQPIEVLPLNRARLNHNSKWVKTLSRLLCYRKYGVCTVLLLQVAFSANSFTNFLLLTGEVC